MDKLQRVLNFAIEKHAGQKDKSGIDYINHPVYLAMQCESVSEKIVALLHDVIEDTDATIDDLMDLELNEEEITAILTLTHQKDVAYMDYIKRIKENKLATKIKLLDLEHNLSDRGSFDKKESLVKRYKKAQDYLKEE